MSKKRPVDEEKRQDAHIFEIKEELCVWMKARVVNFKLCDRRYDCLSCRFDKAMQEAWGQDIGNEEV